MKRMFAMLVDDAEWVKHEEYPGVFVKPFLTGEEGLGFKTVWVKVVPGGEILLHTHDVTEVFLIWQGEGNIGEETLRRGAIMAAPAGQEHFLRNDGAEDVILLANFTA